MLDVKKVLAKLLVQAAFPVTIKSWSGQSVPLTTYKAMATLTIPAGTKALIIANTGNGIGGANNNICNFNLSAGTTNRWIPFSSNNADGAGNFTVGLAYIEAKTQCTVQVRQYGYTQAFTAANGNVMALVLQGDKVT